MISYRIIQEKALGMSEVREFKGSKCWLKNFLRRKKIVGKYEIGWRS